MGEPAGSEAPVSRAHARLRGALEPAEGPGDDRLSDFGAVAASALSAASCARFEPLDSTSTRPAGAYSRSDNARGRRGTDLVDVVVERADQDASTGRGRCRPRRQRRQGGRPDAADRSSTSRVTRRPDRAAQPAVGVEPDEPFCIAPGGQQTVDDLVDLGSGPCAP